MSDSRHSPSGICWPPAMQVALAARLKRVSNCYDVSVVVVNQITSKPEESFEQAGPFLFIDEIRERALKSLTAALAPSAESLGASRNQTAPARIPRPCRVSRLASSMRIASYPSTPSKAIPPLDLSPCPRLVFHGRIASIRGWCLHDVPCHRQTPPTTRRRPVAAGRSNGVSSSGRGNYVGGSHSCRRHTTCSCMLNTTVLSPGWRRGRGAA